MQHSHIVAIKASGNVFSHEAVQQFNVKLKSWLDLITEEPFTRADILTIQVCLLLTRTCLHCEAGQLSVRQANSCLVHIMHLRSQKCMLDCMS